VGGSGPLHLNGKFLPTDFDNLLRDLLRMGELLLLLLLLLLLR